MSVLKTPQELFDYYVERFPDEDWGSDDFERLYIQGVIDGRRAGEVHPKGSMFLGMNVGSATYGAVDYELTMTTSGAPMIRSSKTGKYWTPSWQELIDLAIANGIDHE